MRSCRSDDVWPIIITTPNLQRRRDRCQPSGDQKKPALESFGSFPSMKKGYARRLGSMWSPTRRMSSKPASKAGAEASCEANCGNCWESVLLHKSWAQYAKP